MAAKELNLNIDAGTTEKIDLTLYEADGTTPLDLTGWGVRMQVRTAYGAPGNPKLSYTSDAGDFVIDALNGGISLTIPAADTDTIQAPPTGRTFYYDIEIYSGEVVHRPFKGTFTVYPQITV